VNTQTPRLLRSQLGQLLSAGVLFAALAAPANAWWNSDWALRKKVVLDPTASGANIAEAVASPAVLLRLSDGNFRFASAQSDGSDIRIVAADDKTLLPYHIETFDPVLDVAFVWVKIPNLAPSARTEIWIYYGYSGNKPTKVDDPKGTYDGNTVLLYHFSEHGQPAFDYSGNANSSASPGTPDDGSLIGTGIRLLGREAMTIPASPSLALAEGSSFTWSAWIKATELPAKGPLYIRRTEGRNLTIGVDGGVPYVEIVDASGPHRTSTTSTISAGSWHLLTVTATGQRVSLYLDQDLYASFPGALPQLDGPSSIGGEQSGPGFVGSMDELQIARVARSASAIRLAAANQGGETADKFASFGPDEAQTSWFSFIKKGYVGVIIGSLSADGWVVIAILAVMSVISWIIMVQKARFLRRTVRGNEQFVEAWKHVAADLSVLDSSDEDHAHSMGGLVGDAALMRNSPMYKLYHVGVTEIRARLTADTLEINKMLSATSIQAIRASLDGCLVRETQKLNRNMVLLTIAISGGPFLGLLGTVVGVMITFAAVAAAGDVNVNAIAPGIAAALAATVAGLGVAIPALFGYNYLLVQIKAAVNDMHVFIDEFVTKLAEFYSQTVS
jgi:biopolymer transport protein ExbB